MDCSRIGGRAKRIVVVLVVVILALGGRLIGVAQASHCGPGNFSISGTFTDKVTGQPAPVITSVGFVAVTFGSETVEYFSTTTELPDSTYQICLPATGSGYGITFTAEGYVSPRGDFDVWVSPTPSAGSHIVVDESQVTLTDLYQSELFFYRSDGTYRAYDPRVDGTLPSPLIAGADWPDPGDWQYSDMSIHIFGGSPVDLLFAYRPSDGAMYVQSDPISYHDRSFSAGAGTYLGDEAAWDIVSAVSTGYGNPSVLFYSTDGSYQLRDFGTCMGCDSAIFLSDIYLSGNGYSQGWTSIVPIDLDGDHDDELLFYRASDGVFRYYHVHNDGRLTEPILSGDGYTQGWDEITAVDLDGDFQDEILFYRDDGLFRFYNIRRDGSLPSPILAGHGYTAGWDSITQFESCRILGEEECPFSG